MTAVRGTFVSVCSIDGAGKTTLLKGLHDHLLSRGLDPVLTREPGGTALGEKLRMIVLDPNLRGLSAETEVLLMFAMRAQLVRDVIEPALAAGRWVLSDRFTDASYAYQGGGRGIQKERIAWLEEFATAGLVPDRTLLLDIPVHTGRARTVVRGRIDRIETETDAFFNRVRDTYLDRAAAEPDRFRVIDATPAADKVLASAIEALSGL